MIIGQFLQSSSGKSSRIHIKSEGSRLGPGLPHCHCLLIGISTGLSITQGSCHLAVLGKVESCDFLGLLDLLLVGLYLALQLVNEGLHPLVVLAILVAGKAQLLDGPLGLAEVLGDVSEAPGLSVQLGLELTDAGLHLDHGLPASPMYPALIPL